MAERKARKKRIINQRHMYIAEILEQHPEIEQEQIAQMLAEVYGLKKYTQRTISNDLKTLKQTHWMRASRAMEAIKVRLLDEYQTIYAEAMAAWYLSLEDKQVTVAENVSRPITEQEAGQAIERLKVMERTEGQSGNPALLAQAQAALKAIREMLGLDEAAKVSVSWRDKLPDGYNPDEVYQQFKEAMVQAAIQDVVTDDNQSD